MLYRTTNNIYIHSTIKLFPHTKGHQEHMKRCLHCLLVIVTNFSCHIVFPMKYTSPLLLLLFYAIQLLSSYFFNEKLLAVYRRGCILKGQFKRWHKRLSYKNHKILCSTSTLCSLCSLSA